MHSSNIALVDLRSLVLINEHGSLLIFVLNQGINANSLVGWASGGLVAPGVA